MSEELSQPKKMTLALVQLLELPDESIRTKTLSMLCEGYADVSGIYEAVLRVWDDMGAETAFPEFPLLSYFPIPSANVGDCVQLAGKMASGRKLTDKSVRCAGKLLEQLSWLAPAELSQHLSAVQAVVETSKIFFRVPIDRWRLQSEMQEQSSEQLCKRLDESVVALVASEEDRDARRVGECALDTLRRRFPDVIDIEAAIASAPEQGSELVSFGMAMKSLVQFPAEDTEEAISRHLHDARDSVHANAVEALARNGSANAAARLLLAIPDAPSNNRSWIVRGLQRIRAEGLADELAKVRAQVADPRLWLMLLIAEIHQMDLASETRIAQDVMRLAIQSDAVKDSLKVYQSVHQLDESSELVRSLAAYSDRK